MTLTIRPPPQRWEIKASPIASFDGPRGFKKSSRGKDEQLSLVDVSDIFFFFCLGEGNGESEARGGGGRFLSGQSQEGGGSPGGWGRRGEGREGVCRN